MNWEAINATAQIVSSIAVVASLWYLAVQVNRSTRIAKLTAHDAAATALRDVTKQFSENRVTGFRQASRSARSEGLLGRGLVVAE